MWKPEDNQQELSFSFHRVCPRSQIQVISSSDGGPNLQSYISNPLLIISPFQIKSIFVDQSYMY